MIKIDLKTKIISPKQKIWVVFSGVRRQHFAQFLDEEMVFLDYPSLHLTNKTFSTMYQVRQHVRMSNSVLQYMISGLGTNPPSVDVRNYSGEVFKERSSTVKASNVKRLYNMVSVGDLIIVPGGPFDPVLFGEIDTAFDPDDTILTSGRGVEREVQFRRVKWFKTDVSRSELPRKLQIYLSKPPAIANVKRDKNTERFFKFAYESYILNELSFELFRAPNYSGRDPRETEDANQLISYFSAAYSAIENDKLEQFVSLSFYDAIDEYLDYELFEAYTQVFKSPGQIGMLAAAVTMGGFVSAGTMIAVNNLSQAAEQRGVVVTNSINPKGSERYNKDLQDRINYLFQSLGEAELKKLDVKGKRVKFNLDLKSQADIK